jgi:hypothetical protein
MPMVPGNLLSEFRIAKDKEFAWTKYQETCKLLGTPPISRLKDQLYSGGITFSRYQINPVGLQAITFVITDLLLSSNMTQISLTHMDINSNGLKILADGLCGVDRCPLLVLVLDGNPLRTEPTDRSQDSGQLQANSNKNSYSNTAALTLAAIVEHIRRLSRLSLEGAVPSTRNVCNCAEWPRECMIKVTFENEQAASWAIQELKSWQRLSKIIQT